ncbi:MAG: hypothetical protein COT15_03345 [Candidatus Diapherotrites archaeon CG08_land_8_20_14_0_20_34_12]|nr:MAG: hypothetical protein COT15_03345 [Candidatus Diapherotrites archaeon CG08_land_8_20_14_0_20_34_12]
MKMAKYFLILGALILFCLNTMAYSFVVSTGGWSPSPADDIYYGNYLTVGHSSSSYAYSGNYNMYPSLPAYGYGGYYPSYYGSYYTYGGFAGITTPYYYGRPIIEPYMYHYYNYVPAPLYCSAYWCYA